MSAPNPRLRSLDQPRKPGMVSAIPAAQIGQFTEQLAQDYTALGLTLTVAQQSQLIDYLNHLLHWNALINLSGVTEPEQMLSLHIVDSLAAIAPVAALAQSHEKLTVCDVGTGPGLPAVPWAIALPQVRIEAFDSVRKKIDTLNDFVTKAALANVRGSHARIETVNTQFDIVASRAFSSLENFVTLAGRCVKPSGLMLALKGKLPSEEIAQLDKTGWRVENVVTLRVPRLNAERHNIILRRR